MAALSSFDTRIPFSPSLTRTFRGLRCCEKIRRGRCNGSPHDQPPPRPNPRLEPTPGSDRSDYRETGHNVQTVARQQPSNGSRLNVKRPPIARIHIYIYTRFLEYRIPTRIPLPNKPDPPKTEKTFRSPNASYEQIAIKIRRKKETTRYRLKVDRTKACARQPRPTDYPTLEGISSLSSRRRRDIRFR